MSDNPFLSDSQSNHLAAIAIPICASNFDELTTAAQNIQASQPDVVEWRLDAWASLPSTATIQRGCHLLAKLLPKQRLIATFRSQAEGGLQKESSADYFQVLASCAQADLSFVDIELARDPQQVASSLARCQAAGQRVIASYHDFTAVPTDQVLTDYVAQAESLGADMVKLAVMPNQPADVGRFLAISATLAAQASIPTITMAMGQLGMISRFASNLTGSVLTFARNGDQASAPGQVSIEELRHYQQLLRS
ncbi:type I 3-dehydroquinate dehydratase [Leuconostocaceae bacterium ESL0958]|nr:type I 3-dehydroquinate dehydratase [Leuconostocaceae bacterium ESL0958]